MEYIIKPGLRPVTLTDVSVTLLDKALTWMDGQTSLGEISRRLARQDPHLSLERFKIEVSRDVPRTRTSISSLDLWSLRN